MGTESSVAKSLLPAVNQAVNEPIPLAVLLEGLQKGSPKEKFAAFSIFLAQDFR
jgi:hypothetical protein